MRPVILVTLWLAIACSAPRPMTSAAEEETVAGPGTVMVHEQKVELGDKPVTVRVPVGAQRERLLEIARDPKRTLVLRVEGIGATAQPAVNYEVFIGNAAKPSGVLSLYGIEENNGSFAAAFPLDKVTAEAAAGVLQSGAKELTVTFRPRGTIMADGREVIESQGRVHFTRIRLSEE